jgi:hypothetical protein
MEEQLRQKATMSNNEKQNQCILIIDILYKIKSFKKGYNQHMFGTKCLLVTVEIMQQQVISWTHNHLTVGYRGKQKTSFRLMAQDFWKSMRKGIFNYIDACQACQQLKYIYLGTVPSPLTSANNRFLLVIADYFIR